MIDQWELFSLPLWIFAIAYAVKTFLNLRADWMHYRHGRSMGIARKERDLERLEDNRCMRCGKMFENSEQDLYCDKCC